MSYQTFQDAIHRAMIVDPPEPPHDPPRRIQLRRTKGWRKPDGAIVVARPSKWGNPYKVIIREDVEMVQGGGCRYWRDDAAPGWAVKYAVELFEQRFPLTSRAHAEMAAALRGHDLACWCPLDQPCHADVLLRLANPAPLQECHECWGADHCCPVCHGAGWWKP